MKFAHAVFLAVAMQVLIPVISQAQEFSADVVYLPVAEKQAASAARAALPPPQPGKLYVSKGQLRFESAGVTGQTMLVDDAKQTTVVFIRAAKAYQQLPSRPSMYFQVPDAENACPDWRKAAGRDLNCEKVGNEVVAERSAVKYKSGTRGASSDYIWVDPKLHYVVKWHMDDSEAELRNIKEGPQAAELFEIPPGFKPTKAGSGGRKGHAVRVGAAQALRRAG